MSCRQTAPDGERQVLCRDFWTSNAGPNGVTLTFVGSGISDDATLTVEYEVVEVLSVLRGSHSETCRVSSPDRLLDAQMVQALCVLDRHEIAAAASAAS